MVERERTGDTAALHDEFVFTDDSSYPGETARAKTGIRFCRFQLTEVVPSERVVRHVVDADVTFVGTTANEWTDTNVIFDITATAQGTTLRLTHEGLTAAESECFEACSAGCDVLRHHGLPQLITSGDRPADPEVRR